MLTDPKEIEIISRARQKNVRNQRRSREHFEHIFDDFLSHIDFDRQRFLDLGPGQFDFGVLARDRGAIVDGLDKDPAVLELGRHKGFEVRDYRLNRMNADDFQQHYDGLFCKFSWNAFWFHGDDVQHAKAVHALGRILKAGGWGWIAPWNGLPKGVQLSAERVRDVLDLQARSFAEIGFEGFVLSDRLARRYGVHGRVANNPLFVRGVDIPRALRTKRSLSFNPRRLLARCLGRP